MHVTIKTPEEQEKMRVAGRLAADVLDMIGEHVGRGSPPTSWTGSATSTSSRCSRPIPANVGYRGFPKTICTSVNHVVCHGIPNDKRLKAGDIVNIDVTVISDGFHGDTSRMYLRRQAAGAWPQRLVDVLLRGDVARHRSGAPGRAPRRHRPRHPGATPRRNGFSRGARVLRPRHRPRLPRGSAGAALRRARHRHRAAAPA